MGTIHLRRNVAALASTSAHPAIWERLLGLLADNGTSGTESPDDLAEATAFDVPTNADVLYLGASGIGRFAPVLDRTGGCIVLVEPDLGRLVEVLDRRRPRLLRRKEAVLGQVAEQTLIRPSVESTERAEHGAS